VAAQLVERFPQQPFVLDHLAKPHIKAGEIEPWATGIRRLAEFRNVYCKLSGLVTEAEWQSWKPEQIAPYLDVAFDAFGPERLMIGSDWPVCLVAASYEAAVGVVKKYLLQFSADIRDKVLGENAGHFWKLPR
jgi:L-fuconolactonase